MSVVIWKFELDPFIPGISMPAGAKLLYVGTQSGEHMRVWAEVDPEAPRVFRRVVVVPTGNEVPHPLTYVGSVQMLVGPRNMELVFHVYDGGEVADPDAAPLEAAEAIKAT